MTLASKESRGSYNTVVTNINQKIDSVITSLEALVKRTQANTERYNSKIEALNKKAANLLTYALAVKRVLYQLHYAMPSSCSYEWTWEEPESTCSYGECGEEW